MTAGVTREMLPVSIVGPAESVPVIVSVNRNRTPRRGVCVVVSGRFWMSKNRYSYPMVPVNRGVNARSTARSRPYVSESKRSSLWKCWTTQSAPPRTVVRGST